MNKKLMIAAGFGKEVEKAENSICPFCNKPIKMSDFRNEQSFREFIIFALCQKCQDEMFK